MIEKLSGIVSGVVLSNADMREYTSFRAGGTADLLVEPSDADELSAVIRMLREDGYPYMIIGNGTNVLVRDGGYRGVIIRLGSAFADIDISGCVLKAGCGALLAIAAKKAQAESLTGLEFASGIPGSIGGAVFMNAGAYGGEIKDVILSATVMCQDGSLVKMSRDELDLGYRTSAVQKNGGIVIDASFELKKGDRAEIDERMRDLCDKRNSKQPLQYPSAGSFFKRPAGYFAGKLIQDAGLKGFTVGGAMVSDLHSGFVINKGGATASDIISLMHIVQARVKDKFDVTLEPEVRIIGEDIDAE